MASLASASKHPFQRKVDEVKPSKTDINLLVMDYLVTNGYPSAARKFATEANISPNVDFESIQERVAIRNAIHAGDIQHAIERINELNSTILDSDATLHFSLLRLQLIELIRASMATPNGDISHALSFATSQLAPRAPTNPQFLEDLERTMALLIFPPENLTAQLASLLDPELRKDVATRVNAAILTAQGQRRDSKLRELVKLRAWAESTARDAKKDLPSKLDIGLDPDKTAPGSSQNGTSSQDSHSTVQSNGDGDSIMT